MRYIDVRSGTLHRAFGLLGVAYTGVLLIGLSEAAGIWSAMHSLAFVGLVVLGTPTLLIQAWLLWTSRRESAAHRIAWCLSIAFPLALAALFSGALVLDGR